MTLLLREVDAQHLRATLRVAAFYFVSLIVKNMIRYWKRTEKKTYHYPWLEDISNYSSKELTSPDDSYVSMPFRTRSHVQHSRRMMDKQLQKYFDKTEEALLNKNMSDRWRNLKTSFDSYMNLTPNERRRTTVSDMRGYQLDKNRRILYSFEDNSVYNVDINKSFLNKIRVKSLDHPFTDLEKRGIFDNPYQYTPVSPYRIVWPSADVKGSTELALTAIENSLSNVSKATEDFTNTMNDTMMNFTSSMSNIAQQNALIQQDFSNLLKKEEPPQQEDTTPVSRSKKYEEQYGVNIVYYRDDGKKPTGVEGEKLNRYKRGSNKYREKIDRLGWIDDGHYIWNPAVESTQPITVNNTIQQGVSYANSAAHSAAVQVTETLLDSINQLNTTISQMTAFDMSANMEQIYQVMAEAAAEIRKEAQDSVLAIQDTQQKLLLENTEAVNKVLSDVLDTVKEKLASANYPKSITDTSDSYQDLIKAIKDCQDDWGQKIQDVVNAQTALIKDTEQQMQRVLIKDNPNEEIVPSIQVNPAIQAELKSIHDLFEALKTQYASYIEQTQSLNTQMAAMIKNEAVVKQLTDINTSISTSRTFFQNLLNGMQTKLIQAQNKSMKLLTDEIQSNTSSLLQGVSDTIQNAQTQNVNMLEDIKSNMTDGITALGNTIAQNNLLTDAQTVMLQQIGLNTERMMQQQAYSTWLLQNGFQYIGSLQDKVYEEYKKLTDRPVTPKYLITDQEKIDLNRRLMDTPEPVKVEILEDANQIVPAVKMNDLQRPLMVGNMYPSGSVETVAERMNTDELEYLRDQYVFFMDIIMNYFFDSTFVSFIKEIGFAKLFNAYLKRNQNQNREIYNIFIQLANRTPVTPEMYQTIRNVVSSIPFDINMNIENLLKKTATSIQNMMGSEN